MIRLGKYRNYKGNDYEVVGVAKHYETLQELVVYKHLDGEGAMWVRPIEMWEEEVEVNGKKVIRFKYLDK